MSIKNFVSTPTTPSIFEIATTKHLKLSSTKKPKDAPLFELIGKKANKEKDRK